MLNFALQNREESLFSIYLTDSISPIEKNKSMVLQKILPFLVVCLFCFANVGISQTSVTGVVTDPELETPLLNATVTISNSDLVAKTDLNGRFTFDNVPAGTQTITITHESYAAFNQEITVVANQVTDVGTMTLATPTVSSTIQQNDIPVISIASDDIGEVESQDISGLLSASRDLFASTAGFTWGTRRFRIRGYQSEDFATSLNGIPMNDLESGRVFWGAWGGLNDFVRNQEVSIGLAPVDFAFGGVGGAANINTRASNHRVQKRFSYAATNRSYRNRIMGTYATGMRPNNWGLTVSASRRWAEEGYVEGTFDNRNSLAISVDRKLNNHLINLSVIAAHRNSGGRNSSVQEINDLADDNYYNSNWGFQNGEKRNARVARSLQPIIMLTHDWTINDKSKITTGISFQDGYNGRTSLDWFNTADPRPDYYRRLPSFIQDPSVADKVANELRTNQAARQLDWDSFYEANQNNTQTITEASNVEGGTITGNRSSYIVEDRRFDSQKINFNTVYNNYFSDKVSFSGGLQYNYFKGDYFKEVVDLLGGDFYVDLDQFAERDIPDNPDAIQNDIDNPNRILGVGDRFGYSYSPNIRKATGWAQTQISLSRIDLNFGAELSNTQFWREGQIRNGKFPDNSFGESEKQKFTNYSVKGGAVLKIDGRNYINANSTYRTRAPYFRNAYVSPRTRDQVVSGLTDTKIFSSDLTFFHNSPKYKIRAGAFYTTFKDENQALSFYHDDERTFVNYSVTGIDREHLGIELAASAKLTTTLTAHGVVALGQYIFTSRPNVTVSQDNTAELLQENQTVYGKNFYVSGTPQRAYNVGLSYWGAKSYNFFLNLSYLSDVYIEYNPTRRTVDAIDGVLPDSDNFDAIIEQERGEGRFMLDISGVKSFRWGSHRLSINLSINNLLDVQDFRTGGFEQRRFDFEEKNVDLFPNRYFYANGRTYWASLTYSF